ncbi:MAG: substrate-binding domain-containing protein [Oscillospiraceae bacterium]|nr:substrate-binding domain-containing protein [Oscillospiraceae bacterium]
MRIRSYFVLLLCLCLLGALWGCAKPAPSSPKSVGICLRDDALPIHTAAKSVLTEQIGHTALSEAKGEASMQLRQAEVYLQEGYSLLVAESVDQETALALATLSQQYQTPIIFTEFSTDHTLAEQAYCGSYLGYDPAQAGAALAELLAQFPYGADTNQNGQVAYLLITGPQEDPFHAAAAQGFADAMADDHLLETLVCDGTSESAQQLFDQMLADHGRDIEVVFTTNEAIATGVVNAIRRRGWYPGTDSYVLTISKQDDTQILQNGVSGIAIPDTDAYGALISQLAQDLLKKSPATNRVLAPWIAKR